MISIALLGENMFFINTMKHYFFNYQSIHVYCYIDPYALIEQVDFYDVIFIDDHISMISLSQFLELTENNRYLKVIITDLNSIAVENLKYNIFYYIKKDNLDLDFPLCLNKIMKALSWENHQKLIITWNKKVVSFYYREIKYIQTNKNYVMIHTIKDTKIRSTFKNILKLIKNDDFIVISYGIIVNMRYIKCIDFQTRLLTMDNYETFSLSRKYIKDVKEKYQKKSFVFKIYR